MAEITLLRHGQASFGADNYDCLSPLGEQQAEWLGEHLRQLGEDFDRIVMGSMVRHDQTARGLLRGLGRKAELEIHPGLNEYDFKGLLNPHQQLHPQEWVETGHAKRDYYHNMKAALSYWMDGTIADDGQDTWNGFCERIMEGFRFACDTSAKRILVVSSGGPISVIVGQVLKLAPAQICDVTLQIKNTSTSKILYNRKDFTLDSLNDISHLRHPERKASITFS